MLRDTLVASREPWYGDSCLHAGKVISAEVPAGAALSLPKIKDELAKHKPAVLFLCQVCQRSSRLSTSQHVGEALRSLSAGY